MDKKELNDKVSNAMIAVLEFCELLLGVIGTLVSIGLCMAIATVVLVFAHNLVIGPHDIKDCLSSTWFSVTCVTVVVLVQRMMMRRK